MFTPIFYLKGKSMTIKECIDIVDATKPNQYSDTDKVRWLSQLDYTIANEIIDTHVLPKGKDFIFEQYNPDRDLGKGLIAPPPYDELYIAFLKMKIDEENGETARYNNSATMFNKHYMDFEKFYNKTHMPKQIGLRIY